MGLYIGYNLIERCKLTRQQVGNFELTDMTCFEKLLCRNILFIHIRTCVTSEDQESMTDTVYVSA